MWEEDSHDDDEKILIYHDESGDDVHCESNAECVGSHDGDSERNPSYYVLQDFDRLDVSGGKDSLDHQRGAIDTTQIGPIDMEISSSLDDLGSIECNVPVLQPVLVEGKQSFNLNLTFRLWESKSCETEGWAFFSEWNKVHL